jgi:hypothetical protein
MRIDFSRQQAASALALPTEPVEQKLCEVARERSYNQPPLTKIGPLIRPNATLAVKRLTSYSVSSRLSSIFLGGYNLVLETGYREYRQEVVKLHYRLSALARKAVGRKIWD